MAALSRHPSRVGGGPAGTTDPGDRHVPVGHHLGANLQKLQDRELTLLLDAALREVQD